MIYLLVTLKNGKSDRIPYRSEVSAMRAVRFFERVGAKVDVIREVE